jgi:hypothetical protein
VIEGAQWRNREALRIAWVAAVYQRAKEMPAFPEEEGELAPRPHQSWQEQKVLATMMHAALGGSLPVQ